VEKTLAQIKFLQKSHRPIICTEWMARTANSCFESHLAIFKENHVGCMNWGFVAGKTNTIFPWGSKSNSPEPETWFHDIFHPDGTPYKQSEIDCIKHLTHL